jgi:hypothetical protein
MRPALSEFGESCAESFQRVLERPFDGEIALTRADEYRRDLGNSQCGSRLRHVRHDFTQQVRAEFSRITHSGDDHGPGIHAAAGGGNDEGLAELTRDHAALDGKRDPVVEPPIDCADRAHGFTPR